MSPVICQQSKTAIETRRWKENKQTQLQALFAAEKALDDVTKWSRKRNNAPIALTVLFLSIDQRQADMTLVIKKIIKLKRRYAAYDCSQMQ